MADGGRGLAGRHQRGSWGSPDYILRGRWPGISYGQFGSALRTGSARGVPGLVVRLAGLYAGLRHTRQMRKNSTSAFRSVPIARSNVRRIVGREPLMARALGLT